VNARLDRETAKQLAAVAKREGRSVSDVLRSALQRYCDEAETKEGSVLDRFERLGFVGCGSSGGKKQTDYKQEFLEYVERKHGHR
jgi:hypothetical protein